MPDTTETTDAPAGVQKPARRITVSTTFDEGELELIMMRQKDDEKMAALIRRLALAGVLWDIKHGTVEPTPDDE